MNFECIFESKTDESAKLAKLTLDLHKAGYTLNSHRQETSNDGKELFHISAKSNSDKSNSELEADLANLTNFTLVKIESSTSGNAASSVSKASSSGVDISEILGVIQNNYPKFNKELKIFTSQLPEELRTNTLQEIGARVGTGIYNRDFSLGSPLAMAASIKRELGPALKEFSPVETSDTGVTLSKCPFCVESSQEVASCNFITGFIKGFLDANPAISGSNVAENNCGSGSTNKCTFSISE